MAKLNISADPTLVAAATRMHMANVPKDQAKMLENFTSEYGKLMDNISTNFNKFVEHRDGMKDDAINSLTDFKESLDNGDLDFDKTSQEEFQKMYEEIKDGIAGVGIFDKDRKIKLARLEKEADDLIRKRKSNAEIAGTIIDAYTSDLIADSTDPGLHGLASAIAKDATGKKVDGFKKEWFGGGYNYTYKYTDDKGETQTIRKTLSELSKGLDIKNNEILTKAGNILVDKQKQGAKLGPDGNYTELTDRAITEFEALFKTNRGQGFKDIIGSIVPGTTISYYEALHKPDSPESQLIFSELYNLDKTYDTNNDKKIDKEDFKTPENYEKLVESLTNPKTPDETAVAHRLAANFYGNQEGRKAFEYGQAISGKKRGTDDDDKGGKGWSIGSGKSLAVYGGNRYLDYNVAEDMYNSMDDAVSGKETSFNLFDVGYYYDPKTDTWSEGKGDDATTYGPKDGLSGTERLIKSLGISAAPFKDLKSSVQGGNKTSVSGFDWENLSTDEEDAVSALNKFYADKGLSFKSKPNPFGEYVTFKNTRYDLEDPASVENLKNAVENSVSGGELD
jgi:hypothetical protein